MKERRTKRSMPSSYYEYDNRNYRRSRLLVLIIFFLMIIGVVCFFYVSFVIRNISSAYEPLVEVVSSPANTESSLPERIRERKPLTLLWLGVDDNESGRLVSEETRLISLSLLEVGQGESTRLQIPSESTLKEGASLPAGKLGQVFMMKPLQSIEKATHELLNVPIDYTIEVRFSKLRPLIDRLGGVTLVPKQDFVLENRHLAKGQEVKLTGREVYVYLARQTDENSLSQGQRQMDVLEGLINHLANWQKVPSLDQEVALLQEAIRTDMTFDEFLDLFRAGYFSHMTEAQMSIVNLDADSQHVLLQQLQEKLENN